MDKFDLRDDYRKAYETVRRYAKFYDVPLRKYDDAMTNLLDSLYTAQRNNCPVETIVGRDYEVFSKKYFSVYANKNYWKSYVNDLIIGNVILFVYTLWHIMHDTQQMNISRIIIAFFVHAMFMISNYFKLRVTYTKTVTVLFFIIIFFMYQLSDTIFWPVSTTSMLVIAVGGILKVRRLL